MSDNNDTVIDRGDDIPGAQDDELDTRTTTGDEGDTLGDKVEPEEVEETDEERAEREKAEAEEEKKKRIRIPKARFDEAMHKAREREAALQRQIEELKAQQGKQQQSADIQQVQAQVDALKEKYEDLLLDGKKEEARAVRKQIDQAQDALIDAKTGAKAEAARRAAIEDLKYDAQLAKVEADYPALNPDSAAFDADKTEEVATLMDAFLAKGFTRESALAKAVRYVMGEAQPTRGGTDDAQVLAQRRAEEARRKAAAAAGKQPPALAKAGLDSDKAGGKDGGDVDIMRMDQKQFAKLDEETKARLRGDIV